MKTLSRTVCRLFAAAVLCMLVMGMWSVIRPEPAYAAAYYVSLSSDTLPDGAPGELRYAINQANSTPGADTIIFQYSGVTNPMTITPMAALPIITDTVVLDGYSGVAHAAPPTSGIPAKILIELSGYWPGEDCSGLVFQGSGADNSEVKGLAINEWDENGVLIDGASGVEVDGNNIGTNTAGSAALPNGVHGVFITGSGTNNTVGGTTYAKRNVISGNIGSGVAVESAGSIIYGNFIGTDASGSTNLPNGGGVGLGSSSNTVGGNTAELRNVISGNFEDGIGIGGNNNLVRGNYIGVDVNGDILGNGGDGVSISGNGGSNTIGGDIAAGQGNVISCNSGSGVYLSNIASGVNFIYGNLIGTDPAGTAALTNSDYGVYINNANGQNIGGTGTGQGNVISGNAKGGVYITSASSGNTLAGNLIGTDASGAAALPNGGNGVTLANNADSNVIGGTAAGSRNIISGNAGSGIYIDGFSSACNSNIVQGNYVGINASGGSLGNGGDGVTIFRGANTYNIIGGSRNVISGNAGNGILIDESTQNFVWNNYIGTDPAGTARRANGQRGIHLRNGADANTIGISSGQGNVISGNGQDGVLIEHASHNNIYGNYIGMDGSGSAALSNGRNGVSILNYYFSPSVGYNNIGGSMPGQGNVISGNTQYGVVIDCSYVNNIYQNYIGTDAGGTIPRANGYGGVLITNNSGGNYIGGSNYEEGNVICGNSGDGVTIGGGSSGNTLRGNFIGLSNTGLSLGNAQSGVHISSGPNTVGGNTSIWDRNFIGGNAASGILLDSSNVINVYGNTIGDPSGGYGGKGNGNGGIRITGGANNIGGTAAGQGNEICGNTADGVYIRGCSGNNLFGNRIAGNSGNGVLLTGGADGNTIGGSTANHLNTICANSGSGININSSSGNSVKGNLLGIDSFGSALGNGNSGVTIGGGGASNNIGGVASGDGNVISGNTLYGVYITGSTGNGVYGNRIGTNADGTAKCPNGQHGVFLFNGADGNTIGGDGAAGYRNVVSGNGRNGVFIDGSDGNVICGNYIGTTADGGDALDNAWNGVQLWGDSAGNDIGGGEAGEANVVSGNGRNGVFMDGSGGNNLYGNHIGTNAAGDTELANGDDGVLVSAGSTGNCIGGYKDGLGNLISGNTAYGIRLHGSSNDIQGNRIGTDAGGTEGLMNKLGGILISGGAAKNTVGGDGTAGYRNVISGNGGHGIHISNANNTVVQGNHIGTTGKGGGPLSNNGCGVVLDADAYENTIGGIATAGQGNLISGNGGAGIYISSAHDNTVQGNLIGVDVDGAGEMANKRDGVLISAASNNTIGGADTVLRNVISGNGANGVHIDLSSSGNSVQGNFIGTDVAGTGCVPNAENGVMIDSGADGNTVGGDGTAGQGNVISGNGANGVCIDGATGNGVQGNFIGSDAEGNKPLPNTADGVTLANNANGTIIGGSVVGANLIVNNSGNGVGITACIDCEVSFNRIYGNNGIGIVVWDAAACRDRISQNSIYRNGGLGIDLLGDGVTPNDGDNNDPTLPNRGYDFPEFAAAEFPVVAGNTYVNGTAPAGALVEFYRTEATFDPSGHGGGEAYLGQATADGAGGFTAALAGLADGDGLCAISISLTGDASGAGNTSEFSQNATARTGYTVDASAPGGHGGVDPASQKVVAGGTATIDLAADSGYYIADINDNTITQTVADPYIINDVQEDHTVVVTYGPIPAITTVAPTAAVVGTQITIDGSGFGAARGTSYVMFGGVKATSYISWSDTQIKVKVPAGVAGALNLAVTTAGGQSNLVAFKILPRITKISPKSGVAGSVVTVTGTGFGDKRGTSYAKFGAVKATSYVSWSDTQIKVKVPSGASGAVNLTVTTAGGKSNLLAFKVIPKITRLSPGSGTPGTQVTITGTGFGAKRGSSTVKFGTTAVTRYVSWSNTKIVIKVPSTGAGAKPVKVTTTGGTSGGVTFTVQ